MPPTNGQQPTGFNHGDAYPVRSWNLSSPVKYLLYFFAACSVYVLVWTYMNVCELYLDIPSYVAGHERLPYQQRILPMLLMRGLLHLHLPHFLTTHHHGLPDSPLYAFQFFWNLLSFAGTAWFAMLLYRRIMPAGRFRLLVYPVLLYASAFTFIVEPEHREYFPYDFISMFLFSAGLYCVYTRRFLPLFLIVLVGTFNRETTLFLIFAFVLDAIARERGMDPRTTPWVKTFFLFLTWLSVKVFLSRLYTHNDHTDAFLRPVANLRYLHPSTLPTVVGGCGFLLPFVFLMRRKIQDVRFSAYLWIIPAWVFVMYFYGLIAELRIYGELCPLVAVAVALLLDSYSSAGTSVRGQTPGVLGSPSVATS